MAIYRELKEQMRLVNYRLIPSSTSPNYVKLSFMEEFAWQEDPERILADAGRVAQSKGYLGIEVDTEPELVDTLEQLGYFNVGNGLMRKIFDKDEAQ